MRRVFMFALAVIFAVSLAFAQAGPKKEEKSKPDSTRTKQTAAKDTTAAKQEAKKQAKEKGDAAKKEAAKEKDKSGEVRKTEKKVEKAEKTQKTEGTEKTQQESAKAKDKEQEKAGKSEAAKQKTEKRAATEKAKTAADSTQAKTGEKSGKRYAGDTPLSGHLKRAMFTTSVEDHEPVGSLDSLSTATEQVYFFTEIVGLEGHTVTHRWLHGGEVLAEVPIEVGGPRWRAASSKKLLPGWTGEWAVEVVDSVGTVLGSKHFEYYKGQ